MGRRKKKTDIELVEAAGLTGEPVVATADTEPPPASGEVPPAPPVPVTKTRYLQCKLTKREQRLLGEKISKNFERAEKLEAQLATASADVKRLKGALEGVEQENRDTSRTMRGGFEFRDVECSEEEGLEDVVFTTALLPRKGIITRRLDTGEAIEWRPFNERERQGKLFDEPTKVAS